MNKSCEQKFWTHNVRKRCEQKLNISWGKSSEQSLKTRVMNKSIRVVSKSCEQNLWTKVWTKVANQIFKQKLLTRVVNKSCEQQL